MPISTEERRFIRYWEEQRKGGKGSYVGTYTIGYFIVVFMSGVALGLFTGLRFVTAPLLIGLAVLSLLMAVLLALYQFGQGQKKFRKIIQREIDENTPA